MATGRKVGKQRSEKPPPQPADVAADEDALGEELLRTAREDQAETLGKLQRGNTPQSEADAAAEEDALAEEFMRVSREEEADFLAGWEKFMKQLGIQRKPIGAKELREMLLKRGFDPTDNSFSQGIIAMREE